MKKEWFLAGVTAIAIAAIMGCSSDTASEPTMKYAGTVAPGDFVHFTRTGDTVTYRVEGDVFGDLNGTVKVEDVTGDGYLYKGDVRGETAYFFTAGNIGMAALPLAGKTHMAVGLREAKEGLSDNDVYGTYAYGEADFDATTGALEGATGCVLELKHDNTAEVECVGGSSFGRWKLSEDLSYVLFREGNATTAITEADADARAVIRPAAAGERRGFVLDIAGGQGFGIGLEEQKMSKSDVEGKYFVVDYKEGELSEIKIKADAADLSRLTYAVTRTFDGTAWKSVAGTIGGEILINQGCDGIAHDGIACVVDGDGKRHHGFVDSTGGYFIAVGNDNFIIGVKE